MTTVHHAHPDHRSVSGGRARASVFGVNDGLVSNVSLILGFAATGVDTSIVQLAGIAGAVAGGISMAAGEWISVSSQNDLVRREVEVERRELALNHDAELDELAARYESQGMDADQAREAANAVMADPEVALVVHAREELGVDPEEMPSPWWAGGLSLICFLFGALLPIVPWFIGSGWAAGAASLLIGVVTAALVGALIGAMAERPITIAVARQVGIVLGACTVTLFIGNLFGVTID